MKKAILFEPKLMIEVEQESPAVFENYCQTPFSKLEFADYGTLYLHMYMPISILHMLNSQSKQYSNIELMEAYQCGWVFGYNDLFLKGEMSIKNPLEKEITMARLMMAALTYPYYSLTTLLQEENFLMRGKLLYSTITYRVAQCFEAWKEILNCHQAFNDRFVQLKADAKNVTEPAFRSIRINQPEFKPGLPLDENDSPVDFSRYRKSKESHSL